MPSKKNFVLGRGKLYFDQFVTGTETLTGERYIGSTPTFGLTVTTEKKEHYSAEENLREKDASVTTQIDYMGNFTTDNIDQDNIAMFFLGTKAVLTQAAQPAEVDNLTVKPGRYYQLGQSPVLITGKRNVTVASVTNVGGATIFAANTDFVVDAAMGRIEILETGTIPDDSVIVVTYAVAAYTRNQVVSGSNLIYGALRFIAFNGQGDNQDYYMPKVNLNPNGEYALKGEDWQQIGFGTEILRRGDAPHILVDGRPFVA